MKKMSGWSSTFVVSSITPTFSGALKRRDAVNKKIIWANNRCKFVHIVSSNGRITWKNVAQDFAVHHHETRGLKEGVHGLGGDVRLNDGRDKPRTSLRHTIETHQWCHWPRASDWCPEYARPELKPSMCTMCSVEAQTNRRNGVCVREHAFQIGAR